MQFGSLQITERVCYSRPPTETPQTDTFVEIDNIDANNDYKRVFTGWMFAGSPSLHALDHPVYDVWLLRCKGDGHLIPSPPDDAQTEAPLQPQQPQQQQATQPQTQDAVQAGAAETETAHADGRSASTFGRRAGRCGAAAGLRGAVRPEPAAKRPEQWILHVAVAAATAAEMETGTASRPQAVAQSRGAASMASASCPETRLPFGQAQKSAFCATASASMSR